jgi:hypothetical protein
MNRIPFSLLSWFIRSSHTSHQKCGTQNFTNNSQQKLMLHETIGTQHKVYIFPSRLYLIILILYYTLRWSLEHWNQGMEIRSGNGSVCTSRSAGRSLAVGQFRKKNEMETSTLAVRNPAVLRDFKCGPRANLQQTRGFQRFRRFVK